MRSFYRYRVFFSLGPIGIEPDGWVSFLTACVLVAASFTIGIMYLAHEDGGVSDSLLAAAIAAYAAIGAYLACYTLLKPVILIVFVAAVGIIAIKAMAGRSQSFYACIARPLWFLLAMLGFVTCGMWGWATSPAGFDVDYPDAPENRFLAEHMDTASLFFDENAWRAMSLDEKAAALGEMVVVECNYLGIEEPPSVAVSACPNSVIASYDDAENLIRFNSSYLMTGENGKVAIEAAAHECAHRYQAECVRRGFALPVSESGWSTIQPQHETVEKWAEEFKDYIPASKDFHGYREQDCERSAEAYGMRSLLEIEQRVEKYRKTGVASA